MSALNIAEEMNIAVPERADTTSHPTHPFLWSLRRELWESPSIIGAPAGVAFFIILATLFAAVRYTGRILLQLQANNGPVSSVAGAPLLLAPIFLGITMVGVAFFYSLDAMHSERRDRSILFWKSLPVSDTTTVLSKMAVPMLLLPIVTFIVAIVADVIIFLIENIALLTHHVSLSSAWAGIPVFSFLGAMVYPLIIVTLWYAPIYAWLLLASTWARRAPLLWAVIPFFLFSVFELIAFHTKHVNQFIANRFTGVFHAAFAKNYVHKFDPDFRMEGYTMGWTPIHFLSTPALWEGLIFSALVLILIIHLRRSSDPI